MFHEGDAGHSLHLIASGRVAVRVNTVQGDVATLAVLGPGDTFGEVSIVGEGHERSASVVTLEPTETLSINREDLEQLRNENPAVDRFLVDVLAAHVRRLTGHVIEALYVPVKKRVLRRLLVLADAYEDADEIPLSQDDIASMAGTSRPTANKVLREAEDAGMIDIGRRKLRILDRDALERKAR